MVLTYLQIKKRIFDSIFRSLNIENMMIYFIDLDLSFDKEYAIELFCISNKHIKLLIKYGLCAEKNI